MTQSVTNIIIAARATVSTMSSSPPSTLALSAAVATCKSPGSYPSPATPP